MDDNNSSNLSGVIVGALIVIAVIAGVLWYQKDKRMNEDVKDGGTLYIGITDATADINNVNEVSMSVRKVEVYSANDGWVTVDSNSKDYNLLALKAEGKTELYAKAKVKAGSYDKVRVSLGDTIVKTKTNGDIKAHSPATQVVLSMAVNVKKDKDTRVKLDILADKSLHITTKGEYVFAPVIKAESQSETTVSVANDDAVTTTGGTLDSSVSVGIDLDGASRSDFNLQTGSTLEVDASTLGTIKFMLGGKTYTGSTTDEEDLDDEKKEDTKETSSEVKTDGGASVDLKIY